MARASGDVRPLNTVSSVGQLTDPSQNHQRHGGAADAPAKRRANLADERARAIAALENDAGTRGMIKNYQNMRSGPKYKGHVRDPKARKAEKRLKRTAKQIRHDRERAAAAKAAKRKPRRQRKKKQPASPKAVP